MELVARTENASMAMNCLVASYANGISSHSFGYSQYDHLCSGFLTPLAPSVIEDVEVFGLYFAVRVISYDVVLCLLVLRRLQDA